MDENSPRIPTQKNKHNISRCNGLHDQTHLQEMAWCKFQHTMSVVRTLHENQEPSHTHGHIPWLVCEVALKDCRFTSYHHHHRHHHLYYHYHYQYYYHICHVCYLRRLMRGLGWGRSLIGGVTHHSIGRPRKKERLEGHLTSWRAPGLPSFLLESSLLPLGLPLINQGRQGNRRLLLTCRPTTPTTTTTTTMSRFVTLRISSHLLD